MSRKSSNVILITVVLGALLGGILGYYLPHVMLSLSFIGQLWVNALKILVIPLVVASIIIAVAAMGQMKKVSRTLRNMLVYFVATGAIAVAIGLLAVLTIRPGVLTSTNGTFIPDDITRIGTLSAPEIIGSIIPDNFLLATAEGQLLGLIILSLVFGIVLAGMEDKESKPVMSFVTGFNDVIAKLISYVVYASPLGVFFLVSKAVALNGITMANLVGPLGAYSLTLALAFLLHGLLVLPLAAKLYGHQRPYRFLGNLLPAVTTAFASGSSSATLPVTYENVVEDSEIDRRAGALVLPAGAMVNMNGTALFLAVSAVFVGQLFGVAISPVQIIVIGLMALIISFASSLLPHASLLMLGIVINIAGFPPTAFAGIGLILVVDWFWQRWSSALNVWGDAVGAAVVAETFEFKTARSTPPNLPMRRTFGKPPYERSGRTEDRKSERKPERARARTQERPPSPAIPARERVTAPTSAGTPAAPEERASRRERPPRPRRGRPEGRQRPDSRPRPDSPRKEEQPVKGEEKPFKYTLPPVPFHVLEGELSSRKSRPKPADDVEKPIEAKESETLAKTAREQESLERERARLAAQLASMREKESNPNHEPSTPPDTEDTSENRPSPWEASRNRRERSEGTGDSRQLEGPSDESRSDRGESGSSEKPEPSEPAQDKSDSNQDRSKSSDDSKDDVVYGRGRSRRGQQFKREQQSSSESTEESPTSDSAPKEPEFPTENVSFGRSKRKK